MDKELVVTPRLKKEMKTISDNLRKLCHSKSCKRISRCPQHCGCKVRLDLDTALAWSVADNIDVIIGELNLYDYRDKSYTQVLLEITNLYNNIRTLETVVEYHKWKNARYSDIYSLIEDFIYLVQSTIHFKPLSLYYKNDIGR